MLEEKTVNGHTRCHFGMIDGRKLVQCQKAATHFVDTVPYCQMCAEIMRTVTGSRMVLLTESLDQTFDEGGQP